MTQPTLPTPPDGWGPITITPREVWDILRSLDISVRALVQSMSQYTEERAKRDEDVDARFQNHENRIQAIERNRWPIQSVMALTGAGALGVSLFALLSH